MAEVERSVNDIFSLTQIRHLMRIEFTRAQRYAYPVSCLVVALDRAEEVRDKLGYAHKGKVMEGVTGLLLGATRTCDYLGRLLDDRLMAILPHTRREGAEVTAGRIVAAARNMVIPGEASGGAGVTLSVGISHYENENTMFFDDLVDAAEGALDQAAGEGGDRFCYRDPGPQAGVG
ncbi:MAG: diguanylate cyclase [Planctomycetota bacterium]